MIDNLDKNMLQDLTDRLVTVMKYEVFIVMSKIFKAIYSISPIDTKLIGSFAEMILLTKESISEYSRTGVLPGSLSISGIHNERYFEIFEILSDPSNEAKILFEAIGFTEDNILTFKRLLIAIEEEKVARMKSMMES
jgi:hypothetical protein